MAVEKITLDSFNAFIKDGTAVVDFYADWCGPCRMLAPALAARFGISSIPFVARFENGALTHSALGFMPAAVLADKLGI